ncbi:MAG: putative beta-1,3-galactosyltransferase [Microgenomates group bacterium GW2011_GWC1_38_12]|nr:MAG: putative beta-1,3-galactosyltransferase [Microgenomates group bacterium GW2011_GWC1_38_12]
MGKSNKGKYGTNRKPLVSVIIPAYNEEKVIEGLIDSIKKQSHKRIETIVVDDASVDKTVEIAKKFTKLVFTRRHAERSVQRNYGASKAGGEYFLFLDADMELTSDVESVASNYWEKVKAFERSFYNIEGDKITDAARFFPREAFEKVGGYDESITGPEDWDLPDTIRNIGYKIGRINSIIYHYERINSPFKIARKKFYYALKSHRYLKKQNISTFGPKTVYFLRPVFYREWVRILGHPVLSLGMFLMLSLELVYGGLGFFIGKFTNK